MPDWFGTVFGVISGGGLTLFAGWLADKRLTNRERERRTEERRERIAIRQSDFQRETLLALQVAAQKLIRTTAATLFRDVVAHRNGSAWQRQKLPDSLSDDEMHWTTETMLLASRVRDLEVRSLADQLRSQCAIVGFSINEAEAEQRIAVAGATHQAVIQRIGLLVREIDEVSLEPARPAGIADDGRT